MQMNLYKGVTCHKLAFLNPFLAWLLKACLTVRVYLYPDLDYKAVMTEGADVMSELSPCLSAGNVNNSAKLAKQIPDGVSIVCGITFVISSKFRMFQLSFQF